MGLKGSTAEIVLIAHLAPCQGVLGMRLLVRDENSTQSAHYTNKEPSGLRVHAPERETCMLNWDTWSFKPFLKHYLYLVSHPKYRVFRVFLDLR